MPLSNRIIKATGSSMKEGESWMIDTILDEEEDADIALSEEAGYVKEAKEKEQAILSRAETEAKSVLAQAKKEAEQIKNQSQEQGYAEGKESGFQAGYAKGRQEAYAQAEAETEEMKNKARQMISEAQLDIEAYIEEKKESLLALAAHMAEKIVREHLDLAPDTLLELVHPILHQLDREEDFVSLTVHPSIRQELRNRLPELEQHYPGVRFALLADETLEESGCVIETTHKVVDLQVRKQLKEMLAELKEAESDLS